jgi:hypothetical protein
MQSVANIALVIKLEKRLRRETRHERQDNRRLKPGTLAADRPAPLYGPSWATCHNDVEVAAS